MFNDVSEESAASSIEIFTSLYDGGSRFEWNVGTYVADATASRTGKLIFIIAAWETLNVIILRPVFVCHTVKLVQVVGNDCRGRHNNSSARWRQFHGCSGPYENIQTSMLKAVMP
jgi:hypothetical protein